MFQFTFVTVLVFLTSLTSFASDWPNEPTSQPVSEEVTEIPNTPNSAPRAAEKTAEKVTEQAAQKPAPPEAPKPKPQRAPYNPDSNKYVKTEYTNHFWNLNPKEIDTGTLLVKERSTGRFLQIRVNETAPDSSIFSGAYQIRFKDLKKVKPEFYALKDAIVQFTNPPNGSVLGKIANGSLKTSPFVTITLDGQQTIQIFDQIDKAKEALRIARGQAEIYMFNQNRVPVPSKMSLSALSAQEIEDLIVTKKKAAQNELEILRTETIETQKRQKAVDAFNKLNTNERAARVAQGKAASVQGWDAYKKNDYVQAEKSFARAAELDPTMDAYYFQQGVAVHKQQQYQRAAVLLRMAKQGEGVKLGERDYYLGLSYYNLKLMGGAYESFKAGANSDDRQIAPSARFYMGLVDFEEHRTPAARANFQKVIDTSSDPELDSRAENYLEQIIRYEQFQQERARKWNISGTIGESYDSNLLLASDTSVDQGLASNAAGWQSLLQGAIRYRPVYEETQEFAIEASALYTYTLDSSLRNDQSLRNNDRTMISVNAPWSHKGLAFEKGYKFDLIPAYEMTWMSVEDNTTKEILNSMVATLANTLVMSETWFASLNLELRRDNSLLKTSTGDSNSSANKYKLTQANTFLGDGEQGEVFVTEIAYAMNMADGKNKVYNRYDLAGTYVHALPWWELTGMGKLGYYNLNYNQAATNQTDNDYSLTLAATKKLDSVWTTGLTGNYVINNSTVSAYQYKKWSIMLTLSANSAF